MRQAQLFLFLVAHTERTDPRRVLRDMEVASTSDIMPVTHPRQHNPQHRSRSLRRVLDEIASRVGRAGGQGTPVLWQPQARVSRDAVTPCVDLGPISAPILLFFHTKTVMQEYSMLPIA